MLNLPEYTKDFTYSPDLQISNHAETVIIRRIYKHRWLYAIGVGFMLLLCLFFTGMITIMAIREEKPGYAISILLLLVFVVQAFLWLRKTLLSKEMLTLDLTEKKLTFEKNRGQKYYYHFNEIKQWLLVGKVQRQYRGGKVATTQLCLKAKKNSSHRKPLEIFLFTPSIDFKTTLSAGHNNYMSVMKKNAKEKGQEVSQRLEALTQIPWRWQNYEQY